MPFDWREYLDLAKYLQAQAQTGTIPVEAALRSAVSRGYYAAFGHGYAYATTYLQFLGSSKPEDKSQDHGRLRNHLWQRRRAQVAQKLDNLRRWRNACDYEPDLVNTDLNRLVDDAIRAAEYVFQSLLPPQP
jgi:hypothetical protein